MKKQSLVTLLLLPFLASCSKTAELYSNYAYNSVDFMENYYKEQNGVRDLTIKDKTTYNLANGAGFTSYDSLKGIRSEDNREEYPWVNLDDYSKEFGRNNNLSLIDESFAYGYLSKLYDGRVRCEGKYQLSRVQLDKKGYATFFPKKLEDYKYFAFSLRGATDYYVDDLPSPLRANCVIDVHINFYQHITNSDEYNVVTLNLSNVPIPCDAGGDTNLVTVYLAEDVNANGVDKRIYNILLQDTVAMSFDFELKTTVEGLSDDSTADTKYHFAVMLYEVLFPRSAWR